MRLSVRLDTLRPNPYISPMPQPEAPMRSARHFVEWHGQTFTAEPLKTLTKFSSLPPLWAVSRGREFIGTLPVVREETTKEFEVRCARWIDDLLGRTGG